MYLSMYVSCVTERGACVMYHETRVCHVCVCVCVVGVRVLTRLI